MNRDREAVALLREIKDYVSHLGNCSLNSWNKSLTKCDCGLFQLLQRVEAVVGFALTPDDNNYCCPDCEREQRVKAGD